MTIIIILISIFGGTIILTKIMVEDLTSEVIDIGEYERIYKYKKIINLQDSNSYNQLKDIGIFDLGNNTYENIKNKILFQSELW